MPKAAKSIDQQIERLEREIEAIQKRQKRRYAAEVKDNNAWRVAERKIERLRIVAVTDKPGAVKLRDTQWVREYHLTNVAGTVTKVYRTRADVTFPVETKHNGRFDVPISNLIVIDEEAVEDKQTERLNKSIARLLSR